MRGSDRATIWGTRVAHEPHVRLGQPVVERRRRLVARDRHLDLTDDRAGVGGRIGDLEQRHARLREAAEDRPRDRRASAMAREQGRVHPVHGAARRRDERVANELRPADDEDHLRLERSDGRDDLGCVDVGCLDQLGTEPGCDVVERALARAIRVDRPRQRDDADDLRAGRRGRLEAVEADDVEADPDRPQGGANTSRALLA